MLSSPVIIIMGSRSGSPGSSSWGTSPWCCRFIGGGWRPIVDPSSEDEDEESDRLPERLFSLLSTPRRGIHTCHERCVRRIGFNVGHRQLTIVFVAPQSAGRD